MGVFFLMKYYLTHNCNNDTFTLLESIIIKTANVLLSSIFSSRNRILQVFDPYILFSVLECRGVTNSVHVSPVTCLAESKAIGDLT
jgi:hypothetical protein